MLDSIQTNIFIHMNYNNRAMEIVTSQDRSVCFRFDIVNPRDVKQLKFYTIGDKNILVIFTKQENKNTLSLEDKME